MNLLKSLACALACTLLTQVPAVAQSASVAVTNATLYTMTDKGTITTGTLLVKEGKVVALGTDVQIPAGVEVIDAGGGSVTPGLMNSETHLGVEEVSAILETVDFATLNPRITASLKVADAFNPRSVLIPQNRMHGLTRALVMPESGASLIAGQAALVDLSGGAASVIDGSVALVVNLGQTGQLLAGGSRAAAIMQLREALEDARDYAAHKNDFNRGQRRHYALSRQDLAALQPVVEGSQPMIVRVHRAADIRRLLAFAAEQKVKVVLAGVEEGWMLAEEIAAAGVAVIIDPILNLSASYETLGARIDNSALLHKAGVKLLFTGMGWQNTHNAYLVRQSAGNAVANGLPKEAAIAAITRNPAQVFSIVDSYGSLEVGKTADLVVWQGDPLEVTSEARLVLLKGNRVELVSRSTHLADRYLQQIRANLKP